MVCVKFSSNMSMSFHRYKQYNIPLHDDGVRPANGALTLLNNQDQYLLLTFIWNTKSSYLKNGTCLLPNLTSFVSPLPQIILFVSSRFITVCVYYNYPSVGCIPSFLFPFIILMRYLLHICKR